MQRTGVEAMPQQRAVQNTDVLLTIAEDDGVLDRGGPHQFAQRLALALGVVGCLLQSLHDGRGGGGLGRSLDALGRVQEVVRQALDFRRHGRREEQGLPREGEELADALDVGDEAHIEHAVGLVNDKNLDAVEEQLAAPEMIEQAPRRRDHHVGAAIELAVLLVVGHPANQ